jgi:hypothetical protein
LIFQLHLLPTDNADISESPADVTFFPFLSSHSVKFRSLREEIIPIFPFLKVFGKVFIQKIDSHHTKVALKVRLQNIDQISISDNDCCQEFDR